MRLGKYTWQAVLHSRYCVIHKPFTNGNVGEYRGFICNDRLRMQLAMHPVASRSSLVNSSTEPLIAGLYELLILHIHNTSCTCTHMKGSVIHV